MDKNKSFFRMYFGKLKTALFFVVIVGSFISMIIEILFLTGVLKSGGNEALYATSLAVLKNQNFDTYIIMKQICDNFFENYDKFVSQGFTYIKTGKMWRGLHGVHNFYVPSNYAAGNTIIKDGTNIAKFGNICWYTNLPNERHNTPLQLTASYYDEVYKREEYPFLDNENIINVNKTINIPKDYEGLMAVPISFLNHFNSEQFELIGVMSTTKKTDINLGYPYLNGKKLYARVVIKHKHLKE